MPIMTNTPNSYHRFTSYDRFEMSPHYLDWENQPTPFKKYSGIHPVKLPEVSDIYRLPLIDVCRNASGEKLKAIPDASQLAGILALACGLTAKACQPGGDFYFRSAPSAGALYPNELYLAWPGISDLVPGIYHFGFKHRQLTPLREGNVSSVIQQAFLSNGSGTGALFIVSGIFFRSAWKYRSRAYRYVLMDAGHLIENLRLAISAGGFLPDLEFAFDDGLLERLLGIDTEREGCVGCVSIPQPPTAMESYEEIDIAPLPAGIVDASRVSEKEVTYEAILDIHRAGRELSDYSPEMQEPGVAIGLKADSWMPLDTIASAEKVVRAPVMDYAEAVFRRRSRRNFVRQPMKADQFVYLLELLCIAKNGKSKNRPDYSAGVSCGCLVGDVVGVAPGFYLLDSENRQFGRVFEGNRLGEMTAICLDQAWLQNASVHFVLMANLEILDRQSGARGYRYAMITAGRLGHIIYLGATALGMGCCGIGAFYDEEARQMLGLNEASAMLYLLAVGPIKSVR